uniref:Uncharacterized protein n=1 Tax=Anguilla anguilla TaxID=7936 RepID=A0A0E9SRV6_ANGAN
MSCWLYNGR